MEKNNEVIQTHPLVGWDISTVDSYDALMLRLHYQTPNRPEPEGTEVGQTLWLTTDVAGQFISILEAGIAKIESGDYRKTSIVAISVTRSPSLRHRKVPHLFLACISQRSYLP